MTATATKLTWKMFEKDFDQIASFYYDGHFTKVDDEGLVYCYGFDDVVPCDVVFATMSRWQSIYVFYKGCDSSYIGLSFDEVNS
jgi:hypothetical protein